MKFHERTQTLAAFLAALALVTLAISSCSSSGSSTASEEGMIQEVRAVVTSQQTAWNRGDLEGFMDGYERAETTTFVSGDEITRGWQTVLDRYKQHYQSKAQMGTLTFSELEIKPVGNGFAVADGRWQLKRENDAPHGRFTLFFRRNNGTWRIIHDTTTSGTP